MGSYKSGIQKQDGTFGFGVGMSFGLIMGIRLAASAGFRESHSPIFITIPATVFGMPLIYALMGFAIDMLLGCLIVVTTLPFVPRSKMSEKMPELKFEMGVPRELLIGAALGAVWSALGSPRWATAPKVRSVIPPRKAVEGGLAFSLAAFLGCQVGALLINFIGNKKHPHI